MTICVKIFYTAQLNLINKAGDSLQGEAWQEMFFFAFLHMLHPLCNIEDKKIIINYNYNNYYNANNLHQIGLKLLPIAVNPTIIPIIIPYKIFVID